MKTKELIKKVKELGFEIIRAGSHIDIMFNDFIVAGVYTDQMHVMTFYSHEKLLLTNVDKLFDLLVEYAKTPIEDRKEETRFYLRHRYFKCTNGDRRYFQIYESDSTPWLNAMYTVMGYKKQFTLKEIEEIKKKFDTDLKDFEMIVVEDENKY